MRPGLGHRVVFQKKKLYSTLSLFTQVYKWVPWNSHGIASHPGGIFLVLHARETAAGNELRPYVPPVSRMRIHLTYFSMQVLNLFIALLLSAFDTEDDNNNCDDDEGNNCRLKNLVKKLTKTKKTRLFVATFKERYKLYEVQLLESNVTTQGNPLSEHQREGSSTKSENVQNGQFCCEAFYVLLLSHVIIRGGKSNVKMTGALFVPFRGQIL